MKNIYNITTYILLTALLMWAPVAFAGTVTVSNSVSTEANTGGNGTASVSSNVRTVVNGEVVHDERETKTSEDGESVRIEQNFEYTNAENDEGVEDPADVVIETEEEVSLESGEKDMLEEEDSEEVEELVQGDWKFSGVFKTFLLTYVFWWV